MKTVWRCCALAALVALGLSGRTPLRAETIYDDSVNDLKRRYNPGTMEVGDEILLGGTARYLTNFAFEFWGTNSASPDNLAFAGAVQARVRFYSNDGAPFHGYPTPGTVFYDSGWFDVAAPTPRSTFVFSAGTSFPPEGLFIPVSDMTWSVQFRGMGPTDSVGIDIYSPPVAGQSYPDHWERSGTGWTLNTDPALTDFASRMMACGPSLRLDAAALLPDGKFAFRVAGMAPQGFVIQTSTNLSSWVSVGTNSLNAGQCWHTNPGYPAVTRAFFRAVAP